MKTLTLTILFVILLLQSTAQNSEIKNFSAFQLKSYAKSAHREADNYTEIDYIKEYLRKKPSDFKYMNKLAYLYFIVKNYNESQKLYKKLYTLKPIEYYDAVFYLGEIFKSQNQYDSAIFYFKQYHKLRKKQKNTSTLFYISKMEIEACTFAKTNQKTDDSIMVYHLTGGINKAHLETSPQIINDSIFVYSSFNLDSIPSFSTADSVKSPDLKFYAAQLSDNQWEKQDFLPLPFSELNTQSVSNGCFSSDGKRFYFTVSSKNFKNKIISQIYVSKFLNGSWTKPDMPDKRLNVKGFTSTQPTLGDTYKNDLDVLYFVSDRPGGLGGLDIWYTIYNKTTDTYNKPVNAGGYLNTIANETTPYYEKDTKTLYFSSDGLPGYGGFDVFKTNGSGVNWLPAENIGLPLNSSFDDIYFRKFSTSQKGFLVSNRDESIPLKNNNCCYDIFEFRLPKKVEIFLDGNITQTNSLLYTEIYKKLNPDSVSLKNQLKYTIDSLIVALKMKNIENGNSIEITSQTISSDSADFHFILEPNKNYEVNITRASFLPKQINVNTDSLSEGSKIVLENIKIEPIPSKAIIFYNIYFDFNKADLTSDSKNVIDSTILAIMKDYPEIVVEIGAHSDYIGSDDYNLTLSQLRAESVTNYLVTKGIKSERLKAVGYGELIPIAAAITPEGKDIPEGRNKNRRIEFKLIGFIKN